MRLIQQLVRAHSGAVLLSFALAAIIGGAIASGVHIDNSVEHLMMAGDPARGLDEIAKEEFGNDEILFVAFDLGSPYTTDDIRKLAVITEAVAVLDGVKRVRSLANTEDVRGHDGSLDASALIKLDTLDAEFEAIRSRARNHPLYESLLVSTEGSVLGMLVYADSEHSNNHALHFLTRMVVEVVDSMAAPWPVYYAGYPITALEANRIVKRDLAVLTPAALVAVALIVYFFTRRLFPIALLVLVIGWVEMAGHCWLAVSGTPLNVVVSALPTMLMATSAAYVIYAVSLLAHLPEDSEDKGAALVAMLFRPVMLSGLSTGIGFLSLRLIDVEAIGYLGTAMSVGIGAAAIATLLLIPALVERYGLSIADRHVRLLEGVSMIGVRMATRPWLVVGATMALLVVAVPGAMRLAVHTDTLQYFAPENRVRAGAEFFEDKLASGFLLNVVLRGDEPSRAMDPELLGFAETLRERVLHNGNVHRTVSMLDYFYLMDSALRPGDRPRPVPDSREAAAQYLLLYEAGGDPEDYARYINFDRSALSMIVSISGGSRVYLDAAEDIDRFAAANAPGDIEVDTLGTTFLYSRAMDGLTRGMLRGLAVASVLIGLVMLVGLRSARLAALAAIPNLAPIVICGGALGYLDVHLSMGTSLVGCIALGLAVDDTAHVIGHLDEGKSLEEIYALVGPALVITTAALGVGFAALMLSEFESVVALGAAVTATLSVALVADLILLPSLLVLVGYRRHDVAKERGGHLRAVPARRRLAA